MYNIIIVFIRVIGVKNLRVISAAIMPKVPSGNINVPTIMIAEKAYDMMKHDIKCLDDLKVENKVQEWMKLLLSVPSILSSYF